MGFAKYFLIYSVCAVAFAVGVYGANCVECYGGASCNDPLNITVVNTTCPLTTNLICGMYSYKSNTTNATFTARGCTAKDTKCSDLKTANSANITDSWTCYTCNSDLCNKESAASTFGIPLVTLVVAAFAGFYFK